MKSLSELAFSLSKISDDFVNYKMHSDDTVQRVNKQVELIKLNADETNALLDQLLKKRGLNTYLT
jgi:hypothetical protein